MRVLPILWFILICCLAWWVVQERVVQRQAHELNPTFPPSLCLVHGSEVVRDDRLPGVITNYVYRLLDESRLFANLYSYTGVDLDEWVGRNALKSFVTIYSVSLIKDSVSTNDVEGAKVSQAVLEQSEDKDTYRVYWDVQARLGGVTYSEAQYQSQLFAPGTQHSCWIHRTPGEDDVDGYLHRTPAYPHWLTLFVALQVFVAAAFFILGLRLHFIWWPAFFILYFVLVPPLLQESWRHAARHAAIDSGPEVDWFGRVQVVVNLFERAFNWTKDFITTHTDL